MVVVILLKFTITNVVGIVFTYEVELFEVPENSGVKLPKAVDVHLPAHRVDVEDKLLGLRVILVERSSCADKLIEVYCLLSLKVDVVENLGCFFS